jgi:cycloartenol synthase
MGYVYGTRLVYSNAESDSLIQSLRKELYCEDYEHIPWSKTRHFVAPMDNYSPINPIMATVQNILARYESWSVFRPFRDFVRRRGLAFCVDYMAAEDLQTNSIDIGPVNKVLNMISAFHATGGDANHISLQKHFSRVPDYMWLAEDGLRAKGYNGSQCWDTSFAIQAIYEAKLLDDFPEVSRKVWSYLERTQILSTETSQNTKAYAYESPENRKKYFRHVSEGGWPFSTSAHGWPIADCTGEGLKGVLCLMRAKTIQDGVGSGSLKAIEERRLHNAINVLLSYQNEDGGWATYENNRAFGWYESLNPSEVFGDIMIDYSYVELSMASLTALAEFHDAFPLHRCDEISSAIDRGRCFLKSIQREDGSWYGSWACCFCYGIWFGVEGLIQAGEPQSSDCIKTACKFLLYHQRPNGGWGEDFTSCYNKDYADNGMEDYGDDGSGVVNTAWALLALSMAGYEDVKAVKRGISYLMRRQLPSGDWPQEGIAGVFNRACGISYTAYRNVFPIWAIGRCIDVYGSALDE